MSILKGFSRLVVLAAIFSLTLLNTKSHGDGQVEIQFVSFPKDNGEDEVELYLGGDEPLKVELPTNRLSQKYRVKAMNSWVLGKTTKGPDGNVVFAKLGQARALDTPRQLILVIRKGGASENSLHLIPMPNNATNFGGGAYFFLNATPVDVGGILSDVKFSIKPGKFITVEPKPSRVKGVYEYCKVQLVYRNGDEVRPFFNSTWRLNDKVRSLVFFYLDPVTRRVRMHSIRDYI